VKFPWTDIIKFSQASSQYLADEASNKNTKLGYAIKRVSAQFERLQMRRTEDRNDIDVDNCATDEKGIILTEPDGRFRFTKEGLKARNLALRRLDDEGFEVEPYFATEIPEDLNEFCVEAFTKFVIREPLPTVVAPEENQ